MPYVIPYTPSSDAEMRTLDQMMRLADLLYGHPGEYLQRLGSVYDPSRAVGEPICIGELMCGCWIVLDGNNRTGLLVSANPNATVADYPSDVLMIYSYGSWDSETIKWWNPAPKTFAEVMGLKKTRRRRYDERSNADLKTLYGLIEPTADGNYYGVITSAFRDEPIAARSSTPAQLEDELRALVQRRLNGNIDIKLIGYDGAAATHVCRPLRTRT